MKKFIPPLCLIMFLCAWTPIRNPTTPTDVQTDFNSIYDELHTKYQTKYVINVKDYGAKGDSITDDTAVIQAALNTGQSIFIPPTNNYYKINGTLYLTANGQTVSGVGPLSKIVQTGNDPTTASVFIASSVSNVRFENLYVIPGSSVSLITQGFAFYLYNSSNSSVNNCLVTGHRRGGIGLVSCSYCQIKGNTIRDSIVNPATDNHIQSGSDINIFYQSSNNIVMGNTIVNGCGIGISVQTINPGDTAIDNVISGIIRQTILLGILLSETMWILLQEIFNKPVMVMSMELGFMFRAPNIRLFLTTIFTTPIRIQTFIYSWRQEELVRPMLLTSPSLEIPFKNQMHGRVSM